MTKHTNVFLILVLAFYSIVATIFGSIYYIKHKVATEHLLDFQILNNRWKFAKQEWVKVQKLGGGYAKFIYSIGNQERGFGTQRYGISKVDLDIQLLYPIEDWQLRQLIRICKKRMVLPITIDKVKEFAERYNKNDAERWALNVWHWYKKPIELEEKK